MSTAVERLQQRYGRSLDRIKTLERELAEAKAAYAKCCVCHTKCEGVDDPLGEYTLELEAALEAVEPYCDSLLPHVAKVVREALAGKPEGREYEEGEDAGGAPMNVCPSGMYR